MYISEAMTKAAYKNGCFLYETLTFSKSEISVLIFKKRDKNLYGRIDIPYSVDQFDEKNVKLTNYDFSDMLKSYDILIQNLIILHHFLGEYKSTSGVFDGKIRK